MNVNNYCCKKCEEIIPTDQHPDSVLQATICKNEACNCHKSLAIETPKEELLTANDISNKLATPNESLRETLKTVAKVEDPKPTDERLCDLECEMTVMREVVADLSHRIAEHYSNNSEACS